MHAILAAVAFVTLPAFDLTATYEGKLYLLDRMTFEDCRAALPTIRTVSLADNDDRIVVTDLPADRLQALSCKVAR